MDEHCAKNDERRNKTMKYGLYSIRDVMIGFQSPWVSLNDGTATRTVRNALNKGDIENSKDLQLFKIGIFDDETAEITQDFKKLCDVEQLREVKDDVL